MLIEVCFEENKDKLVRKLAYCSNDRDGATDAVHEAFYKAMLQREIPEALPDYSLKAWLYTTAKNHLIDAKRRERYVTQVEDDFDEITEDRDLTDKIFAEHLLSFLTDEQAQIVTLRYFSGMNSSEIGRILNLPSATVRTRLRTAIAVMRSQIQ